jgi:hypothetical protein
MKTLQELIQFLEHRKRAAGILRDNAGEKSAISKDYFNGGIKAFEIAIDAVNELIKQQEINQWTLKETIEEAALDRYPHDWFQDVDTNAFFRSIFIEGANFVLESLQKPPIKVDDKFWRNDFIEQPPC